MSAELFTLAKDLMPGGVNLLLELSMPLWLFPLFISNGTGPISADTSNRQFIDYVGGFGPTILGHGRKEVIEAIQSAAASGLTYGACNPLEVELASLVKSIMPSIDMLRMVNSGTEAAMTAVRLARAATKRNKIIKLTGYHGHTDALLVSAGSGATTLGMPSSPGIPSTVTHDTLSIAFNDIEAVKACFSEHDQQIAAVVLEPICGNMGLILPQKNFLQQVQSVSATWIFIGF